MQVVAVPLRRVAELHNKSLSKEESCPPSFQCRLWSLCSYAEVLEGVAPGAPVFLMKNGRGKYATCGGMQRDGFSARIHVKMVELVALLVFRMRMCYIGYAMTTHGGIMAKTATINMRVNPQVKADAESIFSSFGMTLTEAINVFLHKSVMEGGLPFDVRQPRYNAETEAAIRESRDIMAGRMSAESYESVDDMFAALDLDD